MPILPPDGKRGGGGPFGGGGERGENEEAESIRIDTTEFFFGSGAAAFGAPRFLFALPARATRDA